MAGNFQVDIRAGGTDFSNDLVGLDVFDNIFGYFSRRLAELFGQGKTPDGKVTHGGIRRKSDFQWFRRLTICFFSGGTDFFNNGFFKFIDQHLIFLIDI